MTKWASVYRSVDIAPLEEAFTDLAARVHAGGRTDASTTELVELVTASWPLISTVDGTLVRRMLDAIPEQVWNSDPWLIAAMGASYRSLDSTSRSAALPWFRTASALLRVGTWSVAQVAGIHTSHAAALRSLGQLDDALAEAEAAWLLLDDDVSLAANTRIRCQAQAALQLGLVRLHLGQHDSARALLRLALGLSDRNLVQSEVVECLAGLSLLKYLSGELDSAVEFANLARKVSADSGLIESPFGAAALIAQALVAVDRNEVVDAARLLVDLARASARSDWEPLAHLVMASAAILEGRHIEGLEHVRGGLDSARSWQGDPIARVMCEMVRGLLLMHLGEFASAVVAFEQIAPDADHSICPARYIAGIRYKAGDSAGCLEALQDCDRLGENHSSRTIIDVLLLSAAANYDLDNHSAADVALDRGLLLAAGNRMRAPFLAIANVALTRMLGRASDRNQPPRVHDLLEELRQANSTTVSGSLEPLSVRERDIVHHLFLDKTVNQIASDLYISTNTVKTHVRSIYRKLSANNRKDAVRRVRELGLDVEITPR